MKIQYRPEVDGLRAIAVISVILYHAETRYFSFNPFQGGFIGVDIFFVISGYLITSIILKELEETGKFDFLAFYKRRMKRILPALLFLMILLFPLAYKYFVPNDLKNFSQSIIFSLGFISNHYFNYTGQIYGAENGLLKPFLHTWSLSVEEQFYILFPICLFLVFKFFKKFLFHSILITFLLSLILSEWGSKNYSSESFYFLPTRVWELLSGSILAYLEVKRVNRFRISKLNFLMSILGLILIISSLIFFDHNIHHPSFITVVPILGTCIMIWFLKKGDLIYNILSSRFFVGIGLISYSLYLWHFPIFAFDRITDFSSQSLINKILVIFSFILISIISYFFVEKPSRRSIKFKNLFYIISISIVFIILMNSIVISKNGFPNRLMNALSFNHIDSSKMIQKETGKLINNRNTVLLNDFNKQNIILVGDSHARTLAFNLYKKLNEANFNFSTSIYSGCQFILNTNRVNKKTFEPRQNCKSSDQLERLNFINKTPESIIILFGRLPTIIEEDRFNNYENGFYEGKMDEFIQDDKNKLKDKSQRKQFLYKNIKKTIDTLIKNKHNIILVYPIPEVGVSVPNYLFQRYNKDRKNFKLNDELFSTSYEIYKERTKSSFEILDSFNNNKIKRVYPHKLFCNTILENRCITHDNQNIFYSDSNHPSSKGVELINNLILKEINSFKFTN